MYHIVTEQDTDKGSMSKTYGRVMCDLIFIPYRDACVKEFKGLFSTRILSKDKIFKSQNFEMKLRFYDVDRYLPTKLKFEIQADTGEREDVNAEIELVSVAFLLPEILSWRRIIATLMPE